MMALRKNLILRSTPEGCVSKDAGCQSSSAPMQFV
jgi:hypothetical protein